MRPATSMVQMPYQNPHAANPLYMPVLVLRNTPDDEIERNVRINAARDLPWIGMHPAHDRVAIMCGGGPSLVDHIHEIQEWADYGGVVFAMNGASQFLRGHGIVVDYQVIADAKPETASLVDLEACHHLIASQCDPSTVAVRTTLWHLASDETLDRLFPVERRKRGGYALIGGGATVGNCALCLVYVMGYRQMEVFGYDSCHRGDDSHAYEQTMNRFMPMVDATWAGKSYRASVGMKIQAERFQIIGRQLIDAGCVIGVHGDGLLPAMWSTRPENLTERDKYRLMWATDSYREESPGYRLVPTIMETLKPAGKVIDFGCGTGRASMEFAKLGLSPFLIDFADNCRDEEAMSLPFLEWDLTQPIPQHAPFGINCDVMEHIPTDDVPLVLHNILAAADKVFFQISTAPDMWGEVINHSLHLTVQPHAWWRELLAARGAVTWEMEQPEASLFIVERT